MSLKVVVILLCLALAQANAKPKHLGKDEGFNTVVGIKASNDLSKECVEENWSLIEEQEAKSTSNLLTCNVKAIIEELVKIPVDSIKPNTVLFRDLMGITRDIWDCRHLSKSNLKTCVFKKSVDAFKKAVSLVKILITYDVWYIRLRNNIEECFNLEKNEYQRFVEMLSNTSVKCQ